MNTEWIKTTALLKAGKVVVLPTDTIYGLHCMALNQPAVERLYEIKGRDSNKPFIILTSSKKELEGFGVAIDATLSTRLDSYWPGPNSVVLPVTSDRLEYLHRKTNSLAFRVPNYSPLLDLLSQTGPLVSTSTNPSGKEPATDIATAKEYFGNLVDFYLDTGILTNPPSRVYKWENGNIVKLR